jgi:hypothetical protein
MRIALALGIAVLTAAGVARASAFQAGDVIVSATLTGHITGGNDSGPAVTTDDSGIFGAAICSTHTRRCHSITMPHLWRRMGRITGI